MVSGGKGDTTSMRVAYPYKNSRFAIGEPSQGSEPCEGWVASFHSEGHPHMRVPPSPPFGALGMSVGSWVDRVTSVETQYLASLRAAASLHADKPCEGWVARFHSEDHTHIRAFESTL